MRTEFVDDEAAGRLEVAIDADLGVVTVSGPGIPAATITRAEEAATRPLRMDDSVLPRRPSRGRVSAGRFASMSSWRARPTP